MSTLIQSLQLRVALRKLQSGAKADDSTSIATVLQPANGKMFAQLKESLVEEHDAYMASNSGGPLQDFFTWLISNGPAIIDFIKQIIALFGGK